MNKKFITKKDFHSFLKLMLTTILLNVFFCFSISAQERTVSGTVKDVSGSGLPGVNVFVKGTTIGVVTDLDGKFTIKVPGNTSVISITYIGYKGQEIVAGEQTNLNITLEEDVTKMDEIVVIGYGVQKKKLNTGATLNIGGDDIQALKTSSPMDALKGISPGVSITQNNGVPGSGTKVVIRGIGTTGDSKPLFVVDGIQVGDIDFLSPSDIESIDVLKDAASAAIYGSRAANGVVLVTTKKGKKDSKVEVSYDMYYGSQNVYKKPNLLNAQQYIEIVKEAYTNSNLPLKNFDLKNIPNLTEIENGTWKGTNWFDEIENKDANMQSYSLNINGGSSKSTYSIGGSYLSEDGVLGKQVNSTYKRITLRLNTDNVLLEKNGINVITLGENVSYTNSKKPTLRTGNIYWNDLHNMLIASPLLPMYDSTGNYHKAIDFSKNEANPVALMEVNDKYNYNNNNNILANAYLEIQPVKMLKLRSSYGVNSWNGSSRQWIPIYDLSQINKTTRDQVNQGIYSGSSWTWTNTLSYDYSLGQHNITALVGNEMQKNTSELSMNGHNEGSLFQDAEHAYLDNVKIVDATYTTVNGKQGDNYGWGLMSYFGRLSYDYKETYMFTGVLRADGSSKFPNGHRWGTFPSVSAGWVISNEPFMESTKSWLNFLKLRGSWGQNGNQNVQGFMYLSSQSYSLSDYFFGDDHTIRTTGSFPARVPNEDLTWETSEQTDLGLDMYYFANKLQFSVDFYQKDTRDWLVQPDQPAIWGTSAPLINGGWVSNKGVELVLRWNDQIGEFKYGFSTSLAYNKNKVVDINNSEKVIKGQSNVLSQGTVDLYRAEVGYPIGYFRGLKSDGVFQDSLDIESFVRGKKDYYNIKIDKKSGDTIRTLKIKAGDPKFVDMNGDTVIDDKDKVKIGDPNPHFIFGLRLEAEYKGFYLQVTTNGQAGNQIAKSYRSFADSPLQNYTTDIYNRWHGPGTSNRMPRVLAASNANYKAAADISDLYIEDGDFLRINNITVGCDLKKFIKSMPLAETKIYFTIKNLHTFTKYSGMDPEVGYAPEAWASGVDLGLYPSSQSYIVGLSVKF